MLKSHEEAGKQYCVATGEWNLLGKEGLDNQPSMMRVIALVAGAGFEPATFGL